MKLQLHLQMLSNQKCYQSQSPHSLPNSVSTTPPHPSCSNDNSSCNLSRCISCSIFYIISNIRSSYVNINSISRNYNTTANVSVTLSAAVAPGSVNVPPCQSGIPIKVIIRTLLLHCY
jgi:hypothetical protein